MPSRPPAAAEDAPRTASSPAASVGRLGAHAVHVLGEAAQPFAPAGAEAAERVRSAVLTLIESPAADGGAPGRRLAERSAGLPADPGAAMAGRRTAVDWK